MVSELLAKLCEKKGTIKVIDFGCANGNTFAQRAEGFSKQIEYYGADSSYAALKEAIENFDGFYKSIHFLLYNFDDEDFEPTFREYRQEENIKGYDLVYISSLLLLLKNPQKLLDVSKSVLSNGGQLFVLDIDDRNTCWTCKNPEKQEYYDKLYKRAMQICLNGKTTGNRHSGRNVEAMLKKAGFKNVVLLNGESDNVHGLCTADMVDADKEAFAEMLFGFIKRSVDQPDCDEETKKWFYEHLDEMKAGFLDKDLSFNLGYMTFLASNSELLLKKQGGTSSYESNGLM